jgi:hypothetical protein
MTLEQQLGVILLANLVVLILVPSLLLLEMVRSRHRRQNLPQQPQVQPLPQAESPPRQPQLLHLQ